MSPKILLIGLVIVAAVVTAWFLDKNSTTTTDAAGTTYQNFDQIQQAQQYQDGTSQTQEQAPDADKAGQPETDEAAAAQQERDNMSANGDSLDKILTRQDLIALLKKEVDIEDPLSKTDHIGPHHLPGQAQKDFWKAFKRNAGIGTSSRFMKLAGETILVIEDTPEGNGCDSFYDDGGSHLVSLCGTEETRWHWRAKL